MSTDKHGITDRKRTKRGLSISLLAWIGVLVLILVFTVLWPATTPEYQGKRLTVWLEQLDWRNKSIEREAAGEAIKEIGAKALPYLRSQLQRTDSEPRQWLAEEIGKPFKYTPARDCKLRALAAIRLLGAVARDFEPDLNAMLQRGELPHQVAPAIAAVNSNAVEVLIECLAHTNTQVRLAAVRAAGKVGPHSKQSVDKLLKALDDGDIEVRNSACDSLGMIRSFPDMVLPRLTAALTDTNRYYQFKILSAIRNYGTNAQIAVPLLTKLLDQTVGNRKGEVVATLRVVDEDLAAQVGFGNADLLKMLRSTNEDSKLLASVAIRKSRGESLEFIPALIDSLSDTNFLIQANAMWALADCGNSASNAIEPLTRLLESSPEKWESIVSRAIKRIDPTWNLTNAIRN